MRRGTDSSKIKRDRKRLGEAGALVGSEAASTTKWPFLAYELELLFGGRRSGSTSVGP
jgi:hypothetical protein